MPPLKSNKSSEGETSPELAKSTPNPYAMAVLTALLAGTFSIIGGYFIAGFQARHAIAQKQLEYRIGVYAVFLDKTDRNKSPVISQILNIGAVAASRATDGEIQGFEDRIAELLRKNNAQDLYRQLNSDLNVLRLHGSARVALICDDMLKALLLGDHDIDWTQYSKDVQSFHNRWKTYQEHGVAYGWKEKVLPEERLMVVTIGKLMHVLMQQLRNEIQGEET
jgi:hypothetical protein